MSESNDGGRNTADVDFIRALAELLNRNELTEISVKREYGENDVLNVRVSRQPPVQMMAAAPAQTVTHAPATARTAPGAETGAAAGAGAASTDPSDHPGAVTSPMVGTAYLAAEPGAEPFVTVGQEVKPGQTLMIIEAMKTMNQIPASHGGIVRRILVTDGTPVEYGAPLMIID